MDTVFAVLTFIVISLLAVFMPAPLLAKADPNNAQFIPAPAWYFYALYGLLRMFPQNLSLVPTVILPGLFTMVLLLVPWLDRNPHRALARRPFIIPFAIISVALLVGITLYSARVIGDEIAASPVGQTPVEGYGAPPSQEVAPTIAITYPQAAAAAPNGAAVFNQNCASCHQATGKGLPGAFPPLAGNPVVTGDPVKVISTVMHGMNGPMVMGAAHFNGAMPAWGDKLSPADIAAVVTYIRSSWGNHASPVTEAQVKAASK
jgi:mono/diheme cytochrome c family protein